MRGIHGRLVAAALTITFCGPVAAASADDVIQVACGNTAELASAIQQANADPDHDTIEVTGAPCTFMVSAPAVINASSGNTGLPIITRSLTINGHGATVQRTNTTQAFRLFFASTPNFTIVPRVAFRELTITGGQLTGAGHNGAGVAGFLADVVLDRSQVTANQTAARGGGVAVVGGSLDTDRSVLAFNVASLGSAISASTTQGSSDLRQTSIYLNGNRAGGNSAVLIENGDALVENSTVAANSSPNAIAGVTAFTTVPGSGTPPAANVTVRSSTLADNGQSGSGAAPGTSLLTVRSANAGVPTIRVTDSIVADTDSTAAPIAPPCNVIGGAIVNEGGNLEWPTNTCAFGTVANPRIQYVFGGLGGAELFARLLRDSAAIDLGGADCPAVDQRGQPRPGGEACDAGSYETQPPQTTADGPDGPTNDPQITFASSQPNSTFECRVDGGGWKPCTSPFSPAGLSDGEHTVEVRAVNAQNEVDRTPASVTFTVDRTAPVVEFTGGPASPTADSTPEFTFTVDDDDANVTCQVDGAEPVPCSSPYTTPQLADGEHTLVVRATDAAGNTGSDSATFTVDATAPDTTITSGPSGEMYDGTATYAFTSNDPQATFQCRLDAGPWTSCTSPHTVSGYSEGTHTFAVRAVDPAGNADPTPATRTFTYRRCSVTRVRLNLLGQPVTVCLAL